MNTKDIQLRDTLLSEQELMLNKARACNRNLNAVEEARFAEFTNRINAINAMPTSSPVIFGGEGSKTPVMSAEYRTAFWEAIKNRNLSFTNAALSEGGSAADGSFTVPQSTDLTISPMAQIECSARKLATCIVTEMDLRLPYQASKSVAVTKPETTDLGTYTFANNAPTFGSVTLGAQNIGDSVPISLELLQDTHVGEFVGQDLLRAVVAKEEDVFVNGNGDGVSAPMGFLANGVSSGSAALSINSLLDFSSTLKQAYYANAKWLSNRQSIVQLVKQQLAENVYQRFVEYDANGDASILGWKVVYSSEMPVYSASPAVVGAIGFGDYATGFTLGSRHTDQVVVKMLDQVAALQGQVVLLAYRRASMVCRVAEATRILSITG